jgi:hypothetical protein
MDKKTYRVAVTKIISVTLDLDKLDAEFWRDFNTSIDDRGGADPDYLAEHAAWNFVQGDTDFIEGIGPLGEMNIKISEIDSEVEVEVSK